jgi:fermentation-respiration switch protein FrsA (DUF1100 family)
VRRVFRSMVLILVFVYFGLFFYAYFFADRIAFQPPESTYRDTNQIIKIEVGGGILLSAVYLKNLSAPHTILFSHGNAEDLGLLLPFLEDLRKSGFSVFAYDYRGYGTSNGVPGEVCGYADIESVFTYLTTELEIPANRIIAHGRSLGGSFAIHLAQKKPLAGLVVESSFTSAFRVLTQIPIFPLDRFRNLAKLEEVHCPALFIHGQRDEIIRFSNGENLFQAANQPKDFLWVEQAGHNNLFGVARQRYLQKMVEFSASIRGLSDSTSQ